MIQTQMTEWRPALHKMNSGYGDEITYYMWCEIEQTVMCLYPGEWCEIIELNDLVAIFVCRNEL